MREPQLGIAVGKRGIGKTHTTLEIINQYVMGFNANSKPRRVLILDANDEYSNIKALKITDIPFFSRHPKIEVRRIRPFLPNGKKMGLNDIAECLFYILENYQGGLLLIEDINKYLTSHLPKDLIGAICTNRHNDMDIIMHYQALGKVPTTVWENANWVRFHKNNQSVDRHEKKYEDMYEMFKITECIVDFQFNNGNKRFYVYCDIDNMKIKGRITEAMAQKGVEDYITEQYRRVVSSELNRIGMDGQKVYKDSREASMKIQNKLLKDYFATN